MTSFRELKAYLDNAVGWEEVPNRSRGRSRGGDHWRYQKAVPDGRVLRTKVSRSLNKEIGPSLLGHILRHQLETTMEEFQATSSGQGEDPRAVRMPDVEPMPGWLVMRLIHTVGLDESAVRALTLAEALAAWDDYIIRLAVEAQHATRPRRR